MKEIRYTLVGLGNIGRNLLDVYLQRQAHIEADYGLRFVLVGAADSSGAAMDPAGLDPARVRDLKLAKQGVATYPSVGKRGMKAREMIQAVAAELLVG